jgi:hypothetical protein
MSMLMVFTSHDTIGNADSPGVLDRRRPKPELARRRESRAVSQSGPLILVSLHHQTEDQR